MLYFILLFRLLRILWKEQPHSCWLAHGCGEDKERNQQESQIHHGGKVNPG